MSTTAALSSTALIVTYSASQWTARKHDKSITNEVHTTHNAKDDAGRYNKQLIDKKHMEPISKIVGKARNFHYENTPPWGDNGERLLPTENYFTYIAEMNKLKLDFESAVQVFLANYDTVIAEAKVDLNGMFKQSDYPSRAEIEDKFGYRTSFMPIPLNDIRVQLSDNEVDRLKQAVQEELNQRITGAVSDIWKRIKEQVTTIKEKLSEKESIFRDSLFENLKELLNVIPKLNVTKDAGIAQICEDMKQLLVVPDMARNNAIVRKQTADAADAILNKMDSFFN